MKMVYLLLLYFNCSAAGIRQRILLSNLKEKKIGFYSFYAFVEKLKIFTSFLSTIEHF